jgi:putative membrane protein
VKRGNLYPEQYQIGIRRRFRNSASYDRFWEGRKLWGSLLNVSRSLTRQVLTLNRNIDRDSIKEFVNLLSAFVYALNHQLRRTDSSDDLKGKLSIADYQLVINSKYKPALILNLISDWVGRQKLKGNLDSIQQASIDHNLNTLSDVLGGCERIVSTPIPYSYQVLLHRTIYIYCFLLPFGLVDSLSWFTPFIVAFIAYTFVAFEAIADEIEEPFGQEANDLALNSMSAMIEESIKELAGMEMDAVTNTKGQKIVD